MFGLSTKKLCHIFNQILIQAKIDNFILEVSQFLLSLKQISKFLLKLVILAHYIFEVSLLLFKLPFEVLIILIFTDKFWLIVIFHRYFIFAHQDSYLFFFIFDCSTGLHLYSLNIARFKTEFTCQRFVFSLQKFYIFLLLKVIFLKLRQFAFNFMKLFLQLLIRIVLLGLLD